MRFVSAVAAVLLATPALAEEPEFDPTCFVATDRFIETLAPMMEEHFDIEPGTFEERVDRAEFVKNLAAQAAANEDGALGCAMILAMPDSTLRSFARMAIMQSEEEIKD